MSLLAYWLSNYIWDLASYLAPFAITISLLYAFGIQAYTTGKAAGATIAVLLAFAPAVASFTYVWSFLFKTHSAAQNVVRGIGSPINTTQTPGSSSIFRPCLNASPSRPDP